jgi:hypothetical protein
VVDGFALLGGSPYCWLALAGLRGFLWLLRGVAEPIGKREALS